MGRITLHILLIVAAAFTLAGCGFADSHASLPEFMRAKENEPALEPAPDVKQIVHDHLDSVFVAQSQPQNVQVSPARHSLRGTGWITCVKADLLSATGKPLGTILTRMRLATKKLADALRGELEP